jgi:hypothetical protein
MAGKRGTSDRVFRSQNAALDGAETKSEFFTATVAF